MPAHQVSAQSFNVLFRLAALRAARSAPLCAAKGDGVGASCARRASLAVREGEGAQRGELSPTRRARSDAARLRGAAHARAGRSETCLLAAERAVGGHDAPKALGVFRSGARHVRMRISDGALVGKLELAQGVVVSARLCAT